MMIRPMTAAYAMEELGRPAAPRGGKGGPTPFLANVRDIVSLGGAKAADPGLYSPKALFKIMGAVELMSVDGEPGDEGLDFGDASILL